MRWNTTCNCGIPRADAHISCPHCEAIVCKAEDVDDCPNCGESLDRFYVIPYVLTDEDDCGHARVAIFRARSRDIAQAGRYTSGSFEACVLDGTEAIWGKAIVEAYAGSNFERSEPGFIYNVRSCDCGDEGCGSGSHDNCSVHVWYDEHSWAEFATWGEALAFAEGSYSEHAICDLTSEVE